MLSVCQPHTLSKAIGRDSRSSRCTPDVVIIDVPPPVNVLLPPAYVEAVAAALPDAVAEDPAATAEDDDAATGACCTGMSLVLVLALS